MNNQENEDFEQVFTIGENEDFRVEGEGNILNSPSTATASNSSPNSLPILVAFALVVFLPLAFIALISAAIVQSTTGIRYGDIAIPLTIGTVLVCYIAVNVYAKSATTTATPPPLPSTPTLSNYRATNGKKKKKFKNIQEHRMYLEEHGYDVDSDPRFQNTASQEPPVQINKKKVADEVELAVDALIKLGFGFKKAQDWVMRGITDGILTSDTQGLIRYALSKGASHQNRENK